MAKKKKAARSGDPSERMERPELSADWAVALAEYGARALVAAEHLRIKTRPVGGLPLRPGERSALARLPTVSAKIRKKLTKVDHGLTVAEVASVTLAVAESLPPAEPTEQVVLLGLAERLIGSLQTNVMRSAEAAAPAESQPTDRMYRIKVTLVGTEPPVWRQILVPDVTLDQLHEHIQTAMGWTNSHLHQFKVGDALYGDRDLMADSFDELEYLDSTITRLSDLVPKGRKKLRFTYEYDFGDSWEHELVVETVVPADAGVKSPACLGGERACPPEDVGGFPGYADFLDAIRDPAHEQHEEMVEWIGGRFDPDKFDAVAATRRMRKGLPDWRRMG
jgi:hypothetical protein